MSDSYLGAGDLYINRLNEDGSGTGFYLAGNAIKFEIKAESEIKENISKGRSTYGQVLASAVIPKPSTISISLGELDIKTLAMAFLGDEEPVNNEAADITDAEYTVPDKGLYIDLPHGNFTAAVGVKKADDTALVKDEGFEVQYLLGMIKILPASGLNPGDTVKISYTSLAESGRRIRGATRPNIKAALRLDAINFADGRAEKVEVYEATLHPTAAVDFLSDDFSRLDLEGTLVTPGSKTSPFKVERLD